MMSKLLVTEVSDDVWGYFRHGFVLKRREEGVGIGVGERELLSVDKFTGVPSHPRKIGP